MFDRIKVDEGTEEETAQRYFRQLLNGIAFCHLRGVCHRDLKPENLLLANEGEEAVLKIADFDCALVEDDGQGGFHTKMHGKHRASPAHSKGQVFPCQPPCVN